MDGDHEDLQTQATPQSTDTLLSMSEAELEWSKLKPDFLGLSPDKLYDLPSSLLDSATVDLRTALVDDSANTTAPLYVSTSAELIEDNTPIKAISFLHESKASQFVSSRDDDFVVVQKKALVLCSLISDSCGFLVKARYQDSSPTESFKVTRFVVCLAPIQALFLVAAGKDGVVKVVNVENPSHSYSLTGHRNTIRDLKPMDDSDFCFSCSDDLTIRLWNLRTRVQVAIFQGILCHADSITAIDLHHSQNVLVSAGLDRSVLLWTTESTIHAEKLLSKRWNSDFTSCYGVRCARKRFATRLITQPVFVTYRVHSAGVTQVKFYHDLLVSQDSTGQICVWQPNPARASCSFILVHSLRPGNVTRFALSASLGLLSCVAKETQEVLVWNLMDVVGTAVVSKKGKTGEMRVSEFAADGRTLVAGTKEGLIVRLDATL